MIMAVVPVKDPTGAKERLSSMLSPQERYALALAMLQDVLAALCTVRGLDGIAVVTNHAEVSSIARWRGVEVILEPRNRGESAAVAFAAQACIERGADSVLVLPGDIPIVRPEDIEAVLALALPGRHLAIVPSADETGSNALLLSPPDVIPLHFGPDSFRLHQKEAHERAVPCRIERMPRIALDIDTPDDLASLVAQASATRSYALLEEMGVMARLSAAAAGRKPTQ